MAFWLEAGPLCLSSTWEPPAVRVYGFLQTGNSLRTEAVMPPSDGSCLRGRLCHPLTQMPPLARRGWLLKLDLHNADSTHPFRSISKHCGFPLLWLPGQDLGISLTHTRCHPESCACSLLHTHRHTHIEVHRKLLAGTDDLWEEEN